MKGLSVSTDNSIGLPTNVTKGIHVYYNEELAHYEGLPDGAEWKVMNKQVSVASDGRSTVRVAVIVVESTVLASHITLNFSPMHNPNSLPFFYHSLESRSEQCPKGPSRGTRSGCRQCWRCSRTI